MSPNASTKQLLFLLLSIFLCSLTQAAEHKETNLTVYGQDYLVPPGTNPGPKADDIPITGIPGRVWNYTSFGTVYVFDEQLTEGPNATSAHIGRSQGFYVVSSLDAATLTTVQSIIFTNTQYNGGTILLQGAFPQFEVTQELAVVGGTGKFRSASGYAILTLVFVPSAAIHIITRYDITVQHY